MPHPSWTLIAFNALPHSLPVLEICWIVNMPYKDPWLRKRLWMGIGGRYITPMYVPVKLTALVLDWEASSHCEQMPLRTL